jgi:hypothetical protein
MLTTSGHSSAYIFSSDSTVRKARMTCLHADSIVPLDHEQERLVSRCLQQQQETRRSFLMIFTSRPSSNAESEKLVFKLHAISHLSARDSEEMCRRAVILSPQLAHYLSLAAQSCFSCLRTARPKPSKKSSLSNINRESNNSVQVDIFYLDSVDRRSILHAVDTRTNFSMARLCQNRDLELFAINFEREWVHVHGPPAEVSDDQEFAQGYFQDMLRRHNIAFRA